LAGGVAKLKLVPGSACSWNLDNFLPISSSFGSAVPSLHSISPKYTVSQVVGYIKGKSAIHLARVYGERKRNFVGQHFWARGYFVSTVGRDEDMIREYIRWSEKGR